VIELPEKHEKSTCTGCGVACGLTMLLLGTTMVLPWFGIIIESRTAWAIVGAALMVNGARMLFHKR
jgi:anaerobic selenocysteine-containing dehydrogenase